MINKINFYHFKISANDRLITFIACVVTWLVSSTASAALIKSFMLPQKQISDGKYSIAEFLVDQVISNNVICHICTFSGCLKKLVITWQSYVHNFKNLSVSTPITIFGKCKWVFKLKLCLNWVIKFIIISLFWVSNILPLELSFLKKLSNFKLSNFFMFDVSNELFIKKLQKKFLNRYFELVVKSLQILDNRNCFLQL